MTEQTVFGDLTIRFDDRVLRPRAWTAEQSRWVADLAQDAPPGPILELCAGAGQIGLLASALSRRPLVCVDLNPAACDFARANAVEAGLGDLVEVREGRLEEAVADGETFPLVVADPPWVRRTETGRFPEDPLLAIDGGDDGLDVARACVAVVARHLETGGSAVLQLGTTEQVDALALELDDLVVAEVRQCERGVLARLVR